MAPNTGGDTGLPEWLTPVKTGVRRAYPLPVDSQVCTSAVLAAYSYSVNKSHLPAPRLHYTKKPEKRQCFPGFWLIRLFMIKLKKSGYHLAIPCHRDYILT